MKSGKQESQIVKADYGCVNTNKGSEKFFLKGILFFLKGNFQFWGIFQGKTLFSKLWPLLYKRAKSDLRSTNSYFTYTFEFSVKNC